MEGWIKLHRKLGDQCLWTAEPFTRGQAWVDLVMLASYETSFFYIRGNRVDVQRGQLAWSEQKLSFRWKWSRTKIKNFLKDLEKELQISQQKTQLISIITIINYEEYQQKEPQNIPQKDHRKTTERPQKDIYKKNKEYIKKNKEKEYNIYGSQFQKVKLSEDEYQKLIVLFGEKGTTDRIENMDIYLESKGDKYKSHYATLLSWERKNNTGGSNGNGNGAGKFTQKTRSLGNSGAGQTAYPIDLECDG